MTQERPDGAPVDPAGRFATATSTQVAIVGAGPAGLMLSHLLHIAGVDSVAVDIRSRHQIETTHRAGILERDSVRLLVDSGASDRVLRDGDQHRGIYLRFGGVSHHIDFEALTGASVWLYPQTDVFKDLAEARDRDGGDVRFGVRDVRVEDVLHQPTVSYTDAEGARHVLSAGIVVGADGSHSICRALVADRQQFFREYPFAWFGILCEAPKSSPELIYTRSDLGFALISQRTDRLQRMYFQCDPAERPEEWSDARIWDALQSRLAGHDGFSLREGPIIERSVLPFRSYVQAPLRHGRLLLAGDAGHTVPPTGAKGLNLALADVAVLAEVLERAVKKGDTEALSTYSERALARVWKAQHFSYWMTTMLHQVPGAAAFDEQRHLGELSTLVASEAGKTYLAEGYTGWPDTTRHGATPGSRVSSHGDGSTAGREG
ncbi:4-hydroxybenzoate 3-monooxygenase [Acidiferrimicrobium sp. IK]|uniref:4-hydroxybenzoate 3-monooxygenase n=1 Tax=Acidiferrimicrobium sp. IK TaxID=2871700 RepID=UPI0021CB3495|nr:4-hydroxybenzoate 3-monooxygenase [Acidiferrimicrobium sp. IK]MCU4186760.1 4-hydroxybenzoate 3-monooxygenase [Acidiferrimicrobium sp. IK]